MMPLGLVGIAFFGTFVWVASPEAAVALYAAEGRGHPLVLGALAATGQMFAVGLLFAFGQVVRRRWSWFDRQCRRAAGRHAARLRRGGAISSLTGGLLGLPPLSALAVLGPGLGFQARRWLPLVFALRIVRFAVIAALAARFELHLARH
jgi:hypothetical protein